MIIFPIVALLQRSGRLYSFKTAIHTYNNSLVQLKEFKVEQNYQLKNNHLCFISYPTNP